MEIENNIKIPKIIMQTWKTNDLPEKWKPTQSAIQTYMPEWKYVLMTDTMNRYFVAEHFPDFLKYYDAFPYNIQRADAVRYCWLYVNGGLYFDCDIELLGSIDNLFTSDDDLFLLASSNTPDIITNGFMASIPRHPVWLEMIEEMKQPPGLSSLERHLLVMNTTGPLALNRVIKRSNHKYMLLPSSKLNPYTICDTNYNNKDAITRPLEGSSWVGPTAKIYQWCYCNPNYLLVFGAIALLIAAVMIAIYFNVFPT